MNKKLAIFILILILATCTLLITACNNLDVAFEKSEYQLYNGEKVFAEGRNVTYKLATDISGVTVDAKSGTVTFEGIADYTQVVIYALVKDVVCDMAVCTLRTEYVKPTVEFTNLSNYIVDGANVTAVSTPVCSISYSLKEANPVVAVDSVSGRVTFTQQVKDGTTFTVVAKAKDVLVEKTFTAVVDECVQVENSVAISEYQNAVSVSYSFNFDKAQEAEDAGVIALQVGKKLVKEGWSYQGNVLTIEKELVATLPKGENTLVALTEKNPVDLTLKVAKFITTAEELASINDSKESLSDYYVLGCDIDLTQYLSPNGAGDNGGSGWIPIGKYIDVVDIAKATEYAFKGHFDGNGHTVYGFFIDRTDEVAFNSGLFGYVDSQATICNLGVVQAMDKQHNVRSYSGGFVGVNMGIITNCWVDVDVNIYGEDFRCFGGFVGRNGGSIKNCYSLGAVDGDGKGIGCFSGYDDRTASGEFINCYAVKSKEFPLSDTFDASCKLFADKEAMEKADFSSFDGWILVEGQLPTLPQVKVDYDLKQIIITNTQTLFSRQDVGVQIQVATNPANKWQTLGVTYQVTQGQGVTVDKNGYVHFANFTEGNNVCIVSAQCGEFIDYFEFYVYEDVTSVQIRWSMENQMYAGNSYRIDGYVLPTTANPQITYSLASADNPTLNGITLEGDVITVSPILTKDCTLTITATAVNGTQATHQVAVIADKKLDNYSKVVYRNGALGQFTFTLPSGIAGQLTKVTRYDKSVDFTVNGNDVVLSFADFSFFGNKNIPVKFITDTATYTATVAVYDQSQVIEIATVQEFMQYKEAFNDVTNLEIRKKIVVLTADLDFAPYFAEQEIKSITSIGSSHLGTRFEGIFNGNGHTISNLVIDRNDFSGEYLNEDGAKVLDENNTPYHASRYNVGLFSCVDGVVTNVSFENITVGSYYGGNYSGNFVGVVTGTATGEISNCTFTNCSVKEYYGKSVTDVIGTGAGQMYLGIICGKSTSAKIYNCTIDGVIQN